jgi:hypothetical protein
MIHAIQIRKMLCICSYFTIKHRQYLQRLIDDAQNTSSKEKEIRGIYFRVYKGNCGHICDDISMC